MHGMLFGMETELAFSARRRDGADEVPTGPLIAELFSLAYERIPSLRDGQGSGIFLANGARFYLDCGTHPELCTPECQSPADVVRWQLASERLLAGLASELEKRHPELRIALYRCNVDYGGTGNTWGCHESYQHRRLREELAPQLIPHLATRIVYTGAGGFDNTKDSLEFLLSPRVAHLNCDVGADRVGVRGIYHTRDEALSAGGFHRLHVICGESLCSQLANLLKIGTTALVVRLVDAGVCRGQGLALRAPLAAMQGFARDPSCRERAELLDGRRLTAVEIQAEYLAMVEAELGAEWMPVWAPELCRRWRRVLERLESDPESLATSLDWSIKRALFADRLARSRVSLGELRRGNGLGAELCEIDTRFGELSEQALFHALDASGALDHRIPALGSLEDAMQSPPPGARAEARGRSIRELQEERERYRCGWDAIHDRQEQRVLDLGDPFGTSPSWRPVPVRESPAVSPHAARITEIQRQINRGYREYNALDLERAIATFDGAILAAERAEAPEQEAVARFWCATAHHDGGDLDTAGSMLAPSLARTEGISAATRILLLTRQALIQLERPAPLAEVEQAIEAARSAARYGEGRMGRSRVTLLEARLLGARGRYTDAIATVERALDESSSDPLQFARGSHLRWLLTWLIRTDQLDRARARIEEWRNEIGADGLVSYAGVSLAIAESELALRAGRSAEALEHARRAIERSDGFRHHRCRLAACIAFLESSAVSRRIEGADNVCEETSRWRDVQIGGLRLELRRVESLVRLISSASTDCASSA